MHFARKWIRAVASFAGIGAGLAVSVVALLFGLELLVGGVAQPENIPRILGLTAGFGAAAGAAFAVGVSVLGRGQDGERLPYWKASVAGALATFGGPLAIGIGIYVRSLDLLGPLVLDYTGKAWWLLGIGAAVGAGINHVSRRAKLESGEASQLGLGSGTTTAIGAVRGSDGSASEAGYPPTAVSDDF